MVYFLISAFQTMFSLSLVAVHKAKNETFHVDIDSLPSVSEVLEGMGEYLEAKYGVKFPEIPKLFNGCEDPPTAAIVALPSSATVTFIPEAPLIQAPPSFIAREYSSKTSLAPLSTNEMAPPSSALSVPSSTTAMVPPSSAVLAPFSTTASATSSAQPYKGKVLCEICGKEQAYSNLARHLKIHADKSTWLKCDFPCLYSTPRKDDLVRHKELAHGIR